MESIEQVTDSSADQPAVPDFSSQSKTSEELASWIDEHADGPGRVYTLARRLIALTLPEKPWEARTAINPLQGDLDSQFWFWNRAANSLLDRGYPDDATEIWSASYLAFLSLQQRYHQRYHKGMSLCNIGFAFARGGRGRLAIKSWLLGVIEDSLTNVATAAEGLNYQNLLKMRVSSAVLDQLITTVESRFTRQSITPALPELVIEPWLHPTMIAYSENCWKSMCILMKYLDEAYPGLPDLAKPWEETLAPFWGFSDWVSGVLNGQ